MKYQDNQLAARYNRFLVSRVKTKTKNVEKPEHRKLISIIN